MSDHISEALKDFDEQIAQAKDKDKRKRLLEEKELFVREYRVNNQHEEIVTAQQELEAAKRVNYGKASKEFVDRVVKENDEYMDAAKSALPFINKEFNGVVPFYKKNVILIGARTGHGKSTTVANIVAPLMPLRINGQRLKIGILVNEEKPEDVLNRITCHLMGWKYSDHDQFTDEQRAVFRKMIPILSEFITVISDDFEGIRGTTTTLEGIRAVFDDIIDNNRHYDVILLDYYQKVTESKKNPTLGEYEVQRKLSLMLDTYKNYLPCPVVVFAQVKNNSEEPFNLRIAGTKKICDIATLILEMTPDYENYRTKWIVHKSRFTTAIAERPDFHTGFENGRFVPYSDEYIQKISDIKHDKLMSKMDKENGKKLKEKMEKKDGDNSEGSGN